MSRYRTHHCNALCKEQVGQTVKLAGWAEAIRDHGGVVFVALRDHYGVTQIVIHEENINTFSIRQLSRESVIAVTGQLRLRDMETIDPKLATGEVEVEATDVEMLSKALYSIPFEISESHKTREEVRLIYRYLDLRNPVVHDRILLRAEIIRFLRHKMEDLGFVEIQTPILTASSPEGARDYLVPSRKFRGKFYALPQAPQQFKQLLMISGFDRYFQIAPCFRDEDARADRSPGEFYQLDFEMAFATQEDVLAVTEEVLSETFARFAPQAPINPTPFARITYAESMMRYGTDKPDLRNPLMITDLSEFFAGVDFMPFKNKPVRGIVAPACADRSKSFFERMLSFALSIGMKGLGYISVPEQMELKGPIVKFLSPEQRTALIENLCLKENDTLFFISDAPKAVDQLAGQIRTELGVQLELIDRNRFAMCFITDYPMYERDEETGRIEFTHNPFSMPQGELRSLEELDPLDIKAYQYDIVVNGVELSSGAVRNHLPDVMIKAFEIAGYTREVVEEKFPALFEAFHYGAPPHAGMAPGVDRIVMLLAGTENIREVIAFPMNSNGQDLLVKAPGTVTERQMRDTHIKIR